MIEVDRDEFDEITMIRANGEDLHSDDGETWFLPKRLIGDSSIAELPVGPAFEICQDVEGDTIILDNIPIRLRKAANGRVTVDFDDSGTRKYWGGKVGLKTYMETKKAVVEDRSSEIKDLAFGNYEDDGTWIHLTYSTKVTADKLKTTIELAEQMVAEIDGATEMRLGSELWAPTEAENEKEFTLRTVLPILRKLRFQNVRYSHGKREFGRDILFARLTEFHEIEQWGAQVKFGDIAGGASAEIDTLLGQIDDAFKMPFYDLYTKQKQHISKLAIIASGKFTENAVEKICEKIERHAVRNNVVFIDGEKLKTLAERFAVPG